MDEKAYREWLPRKEREMEEQRNRRLEIWLTFVFAVLVLVSLVAWWIWS